MGIFVEIGKAPTTFLKIYCKRVCLYDALCIRLFPSLHRPVTYIAFRVQIDFLSPFSVPFTFITPPLLLHHKPVLYIAVLMRAFSPLLLFLAHSLDNQFTLPWQGEMEADETAE